MQKLNSLRLLYPLFLVYFYPSQLAAKLTVQPKIKNVIIMIGDGMGPQQVGLLLTYAKYAPNSIYQGSKTALENVLNNGGTMGMAYHSPHNAIVADSASSATQFASGESCGSEMVGLNYKGNRVRTILEVAQGIGKSTGLVSDTRITHATPAAFASHQPHRNRENKIAENLVRSGVTVMLSGGLRNWIPQSANDPTSPIFGKLNRLVTGGIKIKSKRKDEKNLLEEAVKQGYQTVFTQSELQKSKADKILGLFASSGMPDGISETTFRQHPDRQFPTLAEMTQKSLAVLSRNPNGFFLMVEAGQIDWAGHANDAGSMLHEMIRFDKAIAVVLAWVKKHPETLLIITADHETGGFGFSYSRRDIPPKQPFPGRFFPQATYRPNFNFGSYDLLDKLYNQKTSFRTMLDQFDRLPQAKQSVQALSAIINGSSQFKISLEETKKILETEPNDYYVPDHENLKHKIFPKVYDFKEFYTQDSAIRSNLIARAMGKYQNTVWATGTHTNTPVPLITHGPQAITQQFGKIMHTTEWGALAQKIMLKYR